jgi:multicomponent Na+:H+ antiporter subunit B
MFGVSLIVHGHLTPGGGFQGGVVIGATFILLGLAFNKEEGRLAVPDKRVRTAASSGILIFIIVGFIGILAGYNFLTNRWMKFPPLGELGELLSGGTLFWINIGVGLTVSAIAIELFYAFLEEKSDPTYRKNINKVDEKRRWSDGIFRDASE